ncbi:hypothetical protein [Paenibacillus fonticola]|uniref:hypothetical protein n=1 Tax=Paenibacillus fonticola TaxID=379896 RepID=UPI00037D5942|nr:hypothetical protein [Paenibacillus fonticola]
MKINLSSSEIALIISFIGLLITFWNVNRQQKASHKNDLSKWIRDMKQRTNEEFIDLLYELYLIIGMYRSIYFRYHYAIHNDSTDKKNANEFNEYIWEIINQWGTAYHKIDSYYLKRKGILIKFDNNIKEVHNKALALDKGLWEFKGFLYEYIANNQLPSSKVADLLKEIEIEAGELQKYLEVTIIKLQEDFLGKHCDNI